MKSIILITLLTSNLLFCANKPEAFSNGGLSQPEILKIYQDCIKSKPDWNIFEVSKQFIPPGAGYNLRILYNCNWDGVSGYFSAKQITLRLNGETYRNEILQLTSLEKEGMDHRTEVFFTQNPWGGSARLWLSKTMNSAKVEAIRDRINKDEEIEINGRKTPLWIIGVMATSLTETDGTYSLLLSNPFPYTSVSLSQRDSFSKVVVDNIPMP